MGGRVIRAGFFAALAMTWGGYWQEGIRLPRADFAALHAGKIVPEGMTPEFAWTVGMVSHFLASIFLALIYAWAVFPYLKIGAGWLRGVVYGLIVWLVAMIIFMPVVYGAGLFALKAGPTVWVGSLLLHAVWGLVLGVAYTSNKIQEMP